MLQPVIDNFMVSEAGSAMCIEVKKHTEMAVRFFIGWQCWKDADRQGLFAGAGDESMKYGAVVIGGGPGGYACALRLARYGVRTALVEKDLLGGTCLNRGCIPTKTLLFAGALLERARAGKTFGISADAVRPDYEALRSRCAEVTGTLRSGMQKALRQQKVDVIYGKGQLVAAGKVAVETRGEKEILETEAVVLAAGSSPAVPSIPGVNLAGVYTSDTVLSDLPELSRIVIIGGGVISMEFTEAYHAFGAEVTVIESGARVLGAMDSDLARHLTASFRKRGVNIIPRVSAQRITREHGELAVHYAAGGAEKVLRADGVLLAVGRRTDIKGLSLIPLEESRGRIAIDEACRTSMPGVYAVGDIAGSGPQLAHVAEAQGKIAAAAIAGKPCRIRMDLIPSVVYTRPEIASVGLTEEEAKKRKLKVNVSRVRMDGNAKSFIAGESGCIKLIARKDGTLIGASCQCEEASNLISEATLAIAAGIRAESFASIIRPHPSIEESMGDAAENLGN